MSRGLDPVKADGFDLRRVRALDLGAAVAAPLTAHAARKSEQLGQFGFEHRIAVDLTGNFGPKGAPRLSDKSGAIDGKANRRRRYLSVEIDPPEMAGWTPAK